MHSTIFMRYYLILGFIFFHFISYAQLFSPLPSFDTYFSYPFNSSFIHEHHIKTVVITHAIKEDNQRIKSKGLVQKIYFNSAGLPEKELRIVANDTIFTLYYYQKNKWPSIIRHFDKSIINTTYFSFDSIGNKTKQTQCKEQNDGVSKEFFKVAKQEINWTESYQYEKLSTHQTRKKTLNDEGAIYMEGILYTNEKAKTTEENYRYSVTGVSVNYKYNYDANSNLSEKIYFTDAAGELSESTVFNYDTKRNIKGEKISRNKNLIKELIYFYDAKNEIPETILTKYPDTKTFDIQNITLEYF